jgi:hypothetical protein
MSLMQFIWADEFISAVIGSVSVAALRPRVVMWSEQRSGWRRWRCLFWCSLYLFFLIVFFLFWVGQNCRTFITGQTSKASSGTPGGQSWTKCGELLSDDRRLCKSGRCHPSTALASTNEDRGTEDHSEEQGNTCIHTQHTRHMLANRHYSLMCLRWLCQKDTFSTNASWNRFSVRMPRKEMPTTLRALVCKLPFASWDLVMALWCTYPLLVRLLKILRVFEVLFGFDDFESFFRICQEFWRSAQCPQLQRSD